MPLWTSLLPPRRAPPRPPRRAPRICVRCFAGPARHVGVLDRVRVAHLTDLHVGRVTPWRVLEAAVDLVNAQQPDLVALTGDYVCHGLAYLDRLEALLGRLHAPAVGVLGNHDHWSGAREVRRVLTRAGVEVLENASTTLTFRGQRLQVVGVDDAWTGHACVEDAVRGLDPQLPTLGLSHVPEEADALWRHGVPLVLAGHTHAGQFSRTIVKLAGHKYIHGLYGSRQDAGAVYVAAGIGASVVPLRLGERARREIAVFELGCAPGTLEEHHAEQVPLKGRPLSARTLARRRDAVQRRDERRARRQAPVP